MSDLTVPVTKACRKCGGEKPTTTEFFQRHTRASDGLDSVCKICAQAYKTSKNRAKGIKPRVPFKERFWSFVDKNGPTVRSDIGQCWDWTGGKIADGYGRFRTGVADYGRRAMILAHRLSWEFENGPVADAIEVCHICDRPSCVRPSHLFLGTHQENMIDAAKKCRMGSRGEINRHAKLTTETVVAIRAAFAAGEVARAIATRYRVGVSAVYAIVRRRTWRHVA